MLSVFIDLLLTVNVIVSLLIILVVLMQRPKSEGIGAAFGGGMTENLFGAQTSNVLANFTRWLGGLFFMLSLILSILYAKQSTERSAIQAAVLKAAMAMPAATPEPQASPAAAAAPLSGSAATIGGGDLKLGVGAPSPGESLLPGQSAPAAEKPAAATPAPKAAAPTPVAKPAAPAPAAAASPAKSGTR
jgi:protein translocase SecG subunit